MLKMNILMMVMMSMSYTWSNKFLWWQICAILSFMIPITSFSLSPNLTIYSNFSMNDSMSSALIMLSMLITALMLLSSIKILHNKNMKTLFPLMCSILLMTLINAFSSNNLFSFYIWFEASLIPTMMIIILWGYQPERVQASMYMMVYTIMASLPMLMMFIMLYNSPNSAMMIFKTYIMTPNSLNILLISGFLVKLPMFITHLWLPKAHVEAPIAGSMVLAAILLKLGGYGVCRLLFMLPNKILFLSTPLMSISLIGAFLTSMICLRQPDLKSMIAYSSVGHMGLMLSGTLTFSNWGISGTVMMMIAHGLCSSALFSLANINYEILHTRSMFLMKGMMSFLPTMTMWWFLYTAVNMAAPPSINLLSEIMLIVASTSFSLYFMLFLALLSFMTGAYSLNMYGNTQHGNIINFTNSTTTPYSNQYLMLSSHMIPLIALIMLPEPISIF